MSHLQPMLQTVRIRPLTSIASGAARRLSLAALSLAAVAAVSAAPSEAHAQDYPPTLLYSQIYGMPSFGGTQLYARSPDSLSIVYAGDALQVTYWLYKGHTPDPANRVMGGGDLRPGEEGYTGTGQGMCHISKQQAPLWRWSHCNSTASNVDLEPGPYTYVYYWRNANGEPWKTMNVVHFEVKAKTSGTGRFAKASYKWVEAGYDKAAALKFDERGAQVQATVWWLGGEPGNRDGTKCIRWLGLFKGEELAAVGMNRDRELTCDKYWGRKDTTLAIPNRYGNKGDRFTSEMLTDGKWTLVAVDGSVRRMWTFEVKGGQLPLAPRQKEDFAPAWYQQVQLIDPDDGGGMWWLEPGIEQELHVTE